MSNQSPSFLSLNDRELKTIKDELFAMQHECILCPHCCKVKRAEGEKGFCKTNDMARVSSYNLHFGEEPELVGRSGSGTIFFSFCNLSCQYCQNYSISQQGEGELFSAAQLAQCMIELQRKGACNINFVTPTHVLPQIIEALIIAKQKGVRLPLVYNSGGYDSLRALQKIRGIFDIYMPDVKFSSNEYSLRYSGIPDYWDVCKEALREMYGQVGSLTINSQGVAQRGLLVRHLVLPGGIAGSFEAFDFIAEHISRDTYVNIMDQYRPCFKACEHEGLSRRITNREYQEAITYALSKGLHRGFEHGV